MKVTKKGLLKGLAIFVGVSSLSYFSYSFYTTYKRVKSEQMQLEKLEHQNTVDSAKWILKEHEKIEAIRHEVEDVYEESGTTVEIDRLDEVGLRELRYPAESPEAMEQYIQMRLADLRTMGTARPTLRRLFDYEFDPINDKDQIVADHINEERSEFFGDGTAVSTKATVAEVYLHFASMIEFDLDKPYEASLDLLLYNSGIGPKTFPDELLRRLKAIVEHTYVNELGKASIFGLTDIESKNYEPNFLDEYNTYITEELEEEEYNASPEEDDYEY